ncbi:unnamed protein product, partial [Bubo scandiacus]
LPPVKRIKAVILYCKVMSPEVSGKYVTGVYSSMLVKNKNLSVTVHPLKCCAILQSTPWPSSCTTVSLLPFAHSVWEARLDFITFSRHKLRTECPRGVGILAAGFSLCP